MNLMDGWNTSNRNLNDLWQVITLQRRILCFEITELNRHALTQGWHSGTAACGVLPYGANLAAPLSLQSYAKSEFMGPQTGMMESILTL